MRLAFSEGETARLSGQMSMLIHVREKHGLCKAGKSAIASKVTLLQELPCGWLVRLRSADARLSQSAYAAPSWVRNSRNEMSRFAASSQSTRRTHAKLWRRVMRPTFAISGCWRRQSGNR